jgi:hypothetical protein
MVFPIVVPPDPRGPWFKETWIYIISESFHVNMTYSGSVVLEKIFKWTHPIFAFCDYLPFEKDLALYLKNLEFLYPRMIYAKFDWNWLAGSGEKELFFSI